MTTGALDDRITAAFLEGAKSEEVAPLIAEAEAAAVCAGEAAERARDRALDPALTAIDVAAARREMEDAAFRRDRMQRAAVKLAERLAELRKQEEDCRRWISYQKAQAERDKLAAELKEVYPGVVARLADLVARIDANDSELERINDRNLPKAAPRLDSAELMARGLCCFNDGTANIPRMTMQLRLPAFEYNRQEPYKWPRQRW